MGHAARLFNGSAGQTLYGRVTPSPEQLAFLQAKWNALAVHLTRELAQRHGYPVSTWLQGSYKYATLIKPVHKGERYDVDLGLYFEWDPREQNIERGRRPSSRLSSRPRTDAYARSTTSNSTSTPRRTTWTAAAIDAGLRISTRAGKTVTPSLCISGSRRRPTAMIATNCAG
jgi:hypothetical protein